MSDRAPLPTDPARPYAPHGAFVAPAAPACEIWRTLAGLAVAVVAGIALYQLALAVIATAAGPARMQAWMDETTFFADTAAATLWTLFGFGFFAIGLALALRAVHERAPVTVLGPPRRALEQFVAVAGAVGALQLALLALLPGDLDLVRNDDMPMRLWLALLPLSLAAILIQAGTEEAVFRGYLQQQFGARFPRGIAWLVVPAALFGLAHWAPASAGPNASFYVVWATAFGLAAADLTARTGTLGPAVALHVVNNAVAVLGTSLLGPGSGLALYHVAMEADAPGLAALMPGELGLLFVSWLAARVVLRV